MKTAISEPLPPSAPHQSPMQKAKHLAFISLPWLIIAINACVLNHLADTQTRTAQIAASHQDNFGPLWAVLPAAIASGLAAGWFGCLKNRSIAALAITAIAIGLALAGTSALIAMLAVPIVVILMHLLNLVRGQATEQNSKAFAGALLTLICAYASHQRFLLLPRVLNVPVDPDFGSYLKIAQTHYGWNTTFREPLYVWVLQLMQLLGAELNATLLHLVSIGSSLAAIAAIFELCRKRLNLLTAVIAAGFYAHLLFPIYTGCRGLREDLIVCLSLLFILASWNNLTKPVTWKSLILWGLLGAANALLRYSSFSFVLITFAGVAAWRCFKDVRPWPLRARFILPVFLTVALIVPFLYQCKKLYGQTFFLSNFAARFYANEEFGGKHPDFPTKEAIAKDAYTGGVITPRDYVFKYHTKSEIASRIWNGAIKTFFGRNFRESYFYLQANPQPRFTMLLHILGLVFLLFPRRIFLVLLIVLFHAPIFFLAISPTFDPRLLIVAMVFNYITVAAAIGIGFEEGRRLLGRIEDSSPTAAAPAQPGRNKRKSQSRSKPPRPAHSR